MPTIQQRVRLVSCVLALCAGFACTQIATASDDTPLSLQGKHRIEIGVGLLTNLSTAVEVAAGDVTTSSTSDGLVGCVAYTHHFHGDVGILASVGVLDASATTTVEGGSSHVASAAVFPVLFGVKVQPARWTLGTIIRPHVSLAVGPYIGSVSDVQAGATTLVEASTDTALGSRMGIGVDFFFSRFFTVGVSGGYHVVSEFDRPIGSETNYSGPEFSLSVGVALGGS